MLSQLADEYRATCDHLQQRICYLKNQLQTARGDEAIQMRRRIDTLSGELLDLREVMTHLKNYYER